DERPRFADLLRRHLRIVRCVHHDAKQRRRVSPMHNRGRLVDPINECPNVRWSVGMHRTNERMTQALSRKLVCDLHKRVFVLVAIPGCFSVKAIAKKVIKDTGRSFRKALGNPCGEYCLSNTSRRMNYYRCGRSHDCANKVWLLRPRYRRIEVLDQAGSRK